MFGRVSAGFRWFDGGLVGFHGKVLAGFRRERFVAGISQDPQRDPSASCLLSSFLTRRPPVLRSFSVFSLKPHAS